MGKNMDDSKIYFLDFTFNPRTRTLKNREKTIQLRKKQADVLILLCAKYPEPVSQKDFLAGAWGGGYVTSQSIAQVIRSLRLSLDDINKNIIVTIPKLGYQFTAQPSDEEPDKTSQSQHMTSQGRLNEKELIFRMSSGNIKKSEFSTLNMDKSCSLKKKKTSTENFRLRKAFFFIITVILAGMLLLMFVAQSGSLKIGED